MPGAILQDVLELLQTSAGYMQVLIFPLLDGSQAAIETRSKRGSSLMRCRLPIRTTPCASAVKDRRHLSERASPVTAHVLGLSFTFGGIK